MSVQNAGAAIREARLRAGLTQEQLSEGVCSTLSLSRIENGTAGVSPSTFQALMAHAGVSCEVYPAFANRTDFECFYQLKRARFYLDSWQLQLAYVELEQIEKASWADNRFCYQEWLLLYCKLQFRSGRCEHSQLYQTLLNTLQISRPNFDPLDFRGLLLSKNEIELCTLLAQESLYLGNTELCRTICTDLETYLSACSFSYLEKIRLLAENAIVYAKYLIASKDCVAALKTADYYRQLMSTNLIDSPLHELTFLTALGHYYTGDTTQALTYFQMTFISAHSIESCYATVCRHYVDSCLKLSLPGELDIFEDIPLFSFPCKKAIDTLSMGDGTYDPFSPDTLTIGGLIHMLRIEQKISQQTLCQGLCSKSKLSKIENGTLQPEIILTQTLLQRLGISDLVFTFYGNKKETALQELKETLKKTRTYDTSIRLKSLEAMENLCSSEDRLYYQYILYKRGVALSNPDLRATKLQEALEITLPGFDFKYIQRYRLSWLELTILNHLCAAYVESESSVGVFYFYKLLEYWESSPMDILEKKRIYPVSISILIRLLYRHRRHTEIMELSSTYVSPAIKSSIYSISNIYCHYSQCLAECKHVSSAIQIGNYGVQNSYITGFHQNALNLKKDFGKNFNIQLL